MYIAILFVSLFLPSTVLVGVFMHTHTNSHTLFVVCKPPDECGTRDITPRRSLFGPASSFSWSFFHNSHSKSIKLHKFLFSANGGSEAAKEKNHYCSTLTFKIISTLFNDLTLGKESKKEMVQHVTDFPRRRGNSPSLELSLVGGSTTCLLGQIAFKLSYFSVHNLSLF